MKTGDMVTLSLPECTVLDTTDDSVCVLTPICDDPPDVVGASQVSMLLIGSKWSVQIYQLDRYGYDDRPLFSLSGWSFTSRHARIRADDIMSLALRQFDQ